MKKKDLNPPTYLCVAILLMVALHLLFPLMKFRLFPWSLLGLIPLGAGIALNLIADGAFKTERTTVKPFETSSALITNGVFRITRNPMYLGFVFMLTGIALLMESLSPFLVILIFIPFVQIYYIRAEERMLENTFQDAWESYSRQVRRWI